ncbi:MAG TPA: cache domain-containing protein [Vicinamibacterales bacterium]|nr:cache domain-containing protein [Vicinamibacterales bacterium]
MPRGPSGLRTRLFLLLALAIAPPIALLVYEGVERRRDETAQIRAQALGLARLVAEAQRRRLEGARQFLLAMSRAAEVRNGDAAACTAYVRSLAEAHRETYTNIGVADPGGVVRCHALAAPAPPIADRPYFRRALDSGAFSVGDYMIGRISGRQGLGFAFPLRDAGGVTAGVLFANIDLAEFSRSLRAAYLPDGATVTILDRNGTILARSVDPGRWIGRNAGADAVRAMAARGELVTDATGFDGVPRVYAASTVRDDRGTPVLFAVVGLRRDVVIDAMERRLQARLALLAALAACVFAAAWAGAEILIRRPVTRLVALTKQLAAGDLSARARSRAGARELQDLGRAIDEMAERLEERERHLRRVQRLEGIGQLAGGIAHDFNNLLTIIIGYGESLAERTAAQPEAAREASQLLEAARRAATLTHQLLASSRRQTLQPELLHLNDVIRQMESMLARLIGEHIRLETVLDAELGVVRADPAQIEQAILNLAANARDAMPDGGTLTIETANVEVAETDRLPADLAGMPPGGYVVLRVRDTGCGMDEATRARIFEPFFSTKPSGTGLGLATVYGVVRQSGGFVSCRSAPGAGAEFAIWLPRATGAAAHPVARPAAPPSPIPAGGNERILVVEDEDVVRQLVATTLARKGYRVTATGSGAEALAWLEREPADLLVADVVMPGMTGPALAEAARARLPGLRVLFISGHAADTLEGRSVPPGAEFLAKPFTAAALLDKVRRALARDVDPAAGGTG